MQDGRIAKWCKRPLTTADQLGERLYKKLKITTTNEDENEAVIIAEEDGDCEMNNASAEDSNSSQQPSMALILYKEPAFPEAVQKCLIERIIQQQKQHTSPPPISTMRLKVNLQQAFGLGEQQEQDDADDHEMIVD